MNSCRLSPVFGVLSGPHKPPQTQRPCWWLTHGPSLPSSFLPWLWWGLESAFPSLVPGLTHESHPLPLVPTAHNKLTSSLGSQGKEVTWFVMHLSLQFSFILVSLGPDVYFPQGREEW